MTNLILHNAYGILGLTPNATRKEIERQTKEIEKLLKIGEIPRYSLDLSHFDSLRDEKNIKEAKQNLLNMDTKILHYFFAIYISSKQDKESFLQQAQNLYASEDFSAKTFIEKKNIAIYLYIYMSQNGICISVKRYLQLWAEILSIENIEKFKRLYKHDDDLGINDSALNELDSTIRNKAILFKKDIERLKEVAKHNEIANLLDKAKSKADAGEFYEYVFDEIADNICIITPNDSDDYIDQIAIIIGNKAIETVNIKQQSLNLYNNSEAIVRLNKIYETFETRLNLAKRYAKKSKTREWLDNQMPKGSERDMLRTVANRINSGSHTASNGESSGWGAIFWWIVIGFILMAIFGR